MISNVTDNQCIIVSVFHRSVETALNIHIIFISRVYILLGFIQSTVFKL